MGKTPIESAVSRLQALLILIDCIAVAYVSPILVSFRLIPLCVSDG